MVCNRADGIPEPTGDRQNSMAALYGFLDQESLCSHDILAL